MLEGAHHLIAELGVLAHEAGVELGVHAEHVRGHQDLPIAAVPGADADGGDAQHVGEAAGEGGRHLLDHHRERTCRFEGARRFDDRLRLTLVGAAGLIGSIGVDGLRLQSNVAHHRDAGIDQAFDDVADALAALELDRLGHAVLHQAAGVAEGLVGALAVGHEGHVGDHQGALDRARDHAHVVEHLVHLHRQGGVVAGEHHRGRIADQDDVDAGLVDEARGEEVVGGEGRDLLMRLLHLLQAQGGDLAIRGLGLVC